MTTPPPRGPQRVRTDRPSGAVLQVLRMLASAPGPVTITDLQAELGGHPNRFRAHLETLVSNGFAAESTADVSGPGRPARTYTATAVGAQVALEDPGRHIYVALVEAVVEGLASHPDPVEAALALGTTWGRHVPKVGLVETLAAQGFSPSVEQDRILLRTCPMLDLARRETAITCTMHQGMLDAVSGEGLRLMPFAEADGCVVLGLADPAQRRDLS